jgi:hypothetical protein
MSDKLTCGSDRSGTWAWGLGLPGVDLGAGAQDEFTMDKSRQSAVSLSCQGTINNYACSDSSCSRGQVSLPSLRGRVGE